MRADSPAHPVFGIRGDKLHVAHPGFSKGDTIWLFAFHALVSTIGTAKALELDGKAAGQLCKSATLLRDKAVSHMNEEESSLEAKYDQLLKDRDELFKKYHQLADMIPTLKEDIGMS